MNAWHITHDLQYAFRAVRTQPGFAAAAVVILALGIGATTAMFSVVKAVVLNPLPYPEAERLVHIVHNIGGIDQPYFNDAIFLTYAETGQPFESVGAWMPEGQGVTVSGLGEPEEVRALTVSRGFFTTLGVQPLVGRWFSIEEDAPGSELTVLLGEGYWRRRFGGDRSVIGRPLTINARPYQVIGVMPAQFNFGGEADLFLPLRINPARPVPFFRINGIARMKPGMTLAGANADVPRILENYFVKYKANPERKVRWVPLLTPLKQVVVGDVGPTLWLLFGTIAIVLFMACANVATLLLVRSESRRHEFAVRTALGAPWSRVARSLIAESMLLAAAGGALGIALAFAGVRLLMAAEPANLPRLTEITVDRDVLVFALGISWLCGLVFGLIPIARFIRHRSTAHVGVGMRAITLTREHQRSQTALVAVQMALALVLLVSAGLMVRSFQALRNVEPGFQRPETLQTFTVTIPATTTPDLDQLMRMQQELARAIDALPGVDGVAYTTRLPMDPSDRWSAALALEDQPHDGRGAPPNRQVKVISPGAFAVFGTPLVAGRDFTWTDLEGVRDVAIVSENLAREHWGSAQAALGKRIRQYYAEAGPWREIVGVAGDVFDDGVQQEAPPTVYWPARLPSPLFAGYQPRRVSFAIRTERAGTPGLMAELRDALRSIDAGLALASPGTVDELYRRSMSRTSLTLALLAIAGTMALLLGICGIYGVIAYAVAQRRREIGIRMALGAERSQIRALFLRRGLAVAAIGLTIGLAASFAGARLIQSLLFGIEPIDAATFTIAPIVLAAVGVLATYVPARRALAVDPVETMRAE
jgi:predicted permease